MNRCLVAQFRALRRNRIEQVDQPKEADIGGEAGAIASTLPKGPAAHSSE
jgi:hypothetical protein